MSKPMSEEEVLRMMPSLNEFEQKEIWEYVDEGIYFTGRNTNPNATVNYTDSDGFYNVEVTKHIMYRYEVLTRLGRGGYGEVVKAFDHKLNRLVAIKIAKIQYGRNLLNEFTNLNALKRFFPNEHNHILQVYSYFIFRDHDFIVEELLHSDLEKKMRLFPHGLPVNIVKDWIFSTLKGLRILKSADLIHADLKPSNIGLNGRTLQEVKIIDFGISRLQQEPLTHFVQTLPYRAPEVLLYKSYGPPIDMWSLGVVTAELLLGEPLFYGTDEADQLAAIIEVIGLPPQEVVVGSPGAHLYFMYCRNYQTYSYNKMPHRRPPNSRNLHEIFKRFNCPILVDFLEKCLTWDASLRIEPSKALSHEWFKYRCIQLEDVVVLVVLVLLALFHLASESLI